MAREIEQLRNEFIQNKVAGYREGVAYTVSMVRREAILNPMMRGVTTGLLNGITDELIGEGDHAATG